MLRDFSVSGSVIDLADVDWAEWDHRQRLVFARAGKVFAAASLDGKAPDIMELIDLNQNTFSPMEAPE